MALTNLTNLLRSPENSFALLIGLMLFFQPFGINIVSALLMLAILVHSFIFLKKEDWKNGLKNPIFWLPGLFFIYYTSTILWVENSSDGWTQLETKMSLLVVIGVLVANKRLMGSSFKKQITMAFFWGNVCALIVAFVWAGLRTIEAGKPYLLSEGGSEMSFFTYTELSSPYMHVGYLSTMVGVAILFGIEKFFKSEQKGKLVYGLGVLFLSVSLIFLQGRINVLALIITLGLWLLFYAAENRMFKVLLIPVFAIVLLVVLLPFIPEGVKGRYLQVPDFQYDISADASEFNSATYRLAEWKGAMKLIKENPFFGTGVGDNRDRLIESYQEIGFYVGVDRRFNAHNQYLETWIASGIIGLFLLLSIIGYYGFLSFTKRDYTAFFSIVFFATCMLTESMFERAWGVVFFAFYFPLLLLAPVKDEVKNKL